MAADTRNPFIAGTLEIMEYAENRFSGIPVVLQEMKNAGLPAPLFEDQRGVFKVTFFKDRPKNLEEVVGELEAQLTAFCSKPRSREELAQRFRFKSKSYLTSRYIMPLVAEGKLKMTLSHAPKSKKQRFVRT